MGDQEAVKGQSGFLTGKGLPPAEGAVGIANKNPFFYQKSHRLFGPRGRRWISYRFILG
jgi:hypothetical protein